MNARGIRKALQADRILMCTYQSAGKIYSLDDGVPVPKKLAVELTDPAKLQATYSCARVHSDVASRRVATHSLTQQG